MKKGRMLSGLGLAAAAALAATGCGNAGYQDLMKSYTAGQDSAEADSQTDFQEGEEDSRMQFRGEEKETENVAQGSQDDGTGKGLDPEDGREKVMDFGLRLLQHSIKDGENTLISPLSVITALTMTANGARGETLRQMEEVFGASVPELSVYLSAYMDDLPQGDKYRLSMANSIWFTDDKRFTVEQDFLQSNADFFQAGLYQLSFDDSTAKEINRWVEKNTDGMIREILKDVPGDAVMYLVNALSFDAQWKNIYYDNQVREGDFTEEDGTVRKVDLMCSMEYWYLEDDSATGFLKYYADGKYAYGALLPNEGVTVSEYVASLTGEKLGEILDHPTDATVYAFLPKYESEYSIELSRVLAEMGMADAFDMDAADFTGIGVSAEGNIYISRVLHKTFIAVDESGTRAGAATAVEACDGSAFIEPRTVRLDRPFLYMIIDCETNLPVFIGVCRQIG